MEPKTDKSYVEAGPRALGWMIAEVFAGMKEKGMSTREALEVLKAYVTAIARGGTRMTATISPIREAWVCTFCGSEKVMPGPYTALGQYCTGLCKVEGKDRPLILKPAMAPGMVERNARRRFLHTLSGQITKGTLARHSYHAGERIGKGSPPCAWEQQPPCSFAKAQHPSQADLEELGW